MNYNTDKFINLLKEINIELSDEQINQFINYYEMLVETNKVMNLTAITEYDEVIVKHFIDSLSLINAVDIELLNNGSLNIIDIGTGAGFPGIPLKIAFPNINITLLDSLGKRVDFLNNVIASLNLNDKGSVKAIHSRAEDYIKENGIRESFDIAVSRAVSNLAVLSEYCIPYVKENGYFIPYKSNSTDDELSTSTNAISILGGETEDVISFVLPGTQDVYRTFIKIKKTHPTPNKYPRKAGLPVKKPLN